MVFDKDVSDTIFSAGESSNENLEDRVVMTRLKAAFDAKSRQFNELCWEVCVDKPGAKLDQKTATCLSNCVDRFVDASEFIIQRFAQSFQANAAGM